MYNPNLKAPTGYLVTVQYQESEGFSRVKLFKGHHKLEEARTNFPASYADFQVLVVDPMIKKHVKGWDSHQAV